MDILVLTARTEKRHIAYVNFIIEAYDGMAVVRTADAESGLIEILVAPDYKDDFMRLAEALGKEVEFKVM
ncbi:MAG: DUF4911 domain-containing protein [Nitrospirae bacterium]|nr:DUF4911 domain-containing protein [Nitrospirota bacterium]